MKKTTVLCAVLLALAAVITVGVSAQTKSYPDVPSTAWDYEAVMKASDAGLVGGMPDGTFAPKSSLTRAQ